MNKKLLFFFLTTLVLTATSNLKAQLYSNLTDFTGQLPASAFSGVLNASLYDDVEIPDQPGDSINVTQVTIAIYRDATAPAQTYVLYYALLNPNGSGGAADSSWFSIPPTEVTTIKLPKNTTGAGAYTVNFGDSINTLFEIPVPATELITGQKTFFIGLQYGSAAPADTTNGWLICNADNSFNISDPGVGGLWLYNPPSTKEAIYLTSSAGNSPNTMALEVYGNFVLTLPVKFISFDGVLQNNEAVLNWSTASEINNKGFDVERSSDGQNFASIGFVQGNGTTSIKSNYTFSDPKLVSGNNYYRLKQEDYDGKIAYSSVINLQFSKLDWSVLGNPSNNEWMQLQLDKQHNVSIQIVSLSGKVVQTINKGTLGQGTYSIPLDLSNTASGMYIVKLIVDGQSSSKTILK